MQSEGAGPEAATAPFDRPMAWALKYRFVPLGIEASLDPHASS